MKMQTRGEGVKKSENFADIICTCPLRTDFVGYKLPLHPLVLKQTSLVLAALGLSCSHNRVNWRRKRKFATIKIGAKIKLSPSQEKANLSKKTP